jgi:hypothetical protein
MVDVMEHPLELEPLIEMIKTQRPDGDPLDHLAGAVVVSDDLADLADELIGYFVDLARESGASWAEVGARLGVSKQAAQKRYVESPRPRKKRRGLFARFTTEARQLTVRAQEIAHHRGDDHIGTEHLLLALIADEKGTPVMAMRAGGTEPQLVRQAVESALGPTRSPSKGHIPFAPDAKKALELALRESIRLDDRHIGADHILLGMMRDEGSTASAILDRLGLNRRSVEAWIVEARRSA